jgi:Mrp family chromosome partitioning ATPase
MTKIHDALKRSERAAPAATSSVIERVNAAGASSPQTAVTQAYRLALAPCVTLPIDMMIALQRKVRVALPEVDAPIIQIAASRSGEGVTTVAQNFALVLSRDVGARVLLVNPKVAALDAAMPPALQQAFATAGKIDAGIIGCDHPRLFAGWLGGTPVDRVAANLAPMFTTLRSAFDFVVIDSGSVDGWVNEQAFCRLTDALLLVVEAERTSLPLVEQTLETLTTMGAPVHGIVLNRRRRYIPKSLTKFL